MRLDNPIKILAWTDAGSAVSCRGHHWGTADHNYWGNAQYFYYRRAICHAAGAHSTAVVSPLRSVEVQNLAQTAISSATFGAANSLLMPIAVPWALGEPQLVLPLFVGVSAAMLLDAWLLYRLFDTRVFPASNAWPPWQRQKRSKPVIRAVAAWLLVAGIVGGVAGSMLKIPMSAFGTAFIGNIWALTMLGIGFLLRAYAQPVAGIDINALYIPHGVMVGAGLVALIQVVQVIRSRRHDNLNVSRSDNEVKRALGLGLSAIS